MTLFCRKQRRKKWDAVMEPQDPLKEEVKVDGWDTKMSDCPFPTFTGFLLTIPNLIKVVIIVTMTTMAVS